METGYSGEPDESTSTVLRVFRDLPEKLIAHPSSKKE